MWLYNRQVQEYIIKNMEKILFVLLYKPIGDISKNIVLEKWKNINN